MAGDSADLEPRQGCGATIQRHRFVEGDTELVAAQPGGNVGVGLGVDVRIDPQRDRRHLAHLRGDGSEPLELGSGFDIEAANPRLECLAHFGRGLADAGEHDLPGLAPGSQHARQFAARDDVETRTEAREEVEHGEVGVGLDRIEDPRPVALERRCVGAVGGAQGFAGVNIAGRAVLFGQRDERYALEFEAIGALVQGGIGVGAHCGASCRGLL